jgi:hypothetical protein
MQGVYFRANAKTPWVLLRATRSVADAEHLAKRTATKERRGKLLYLEALELPADVWDLRGFDHRRLGGWLCKALLSGFRKEKRAGRNVWKPHDERQLSLFSLTK